jgi:predicted TIM-barrel fold metal-dependent hydrolase
MAEPLDLWANRLPRALRDNAPRPHAPAQSEAPQYARGRGWDPVARLQDLAWDGISAEVLYPTLGVQMYRVDEPEVEEAWARVYNDYVIEFCSVAPDRYWGLALLSMYDVDHAIAEMERCRAAGMVGATIWLVPPDHLLFSDPDHYERFWAAAQDLEMPVSLHINAGHGQYRARPPASSVAKQRYSVNFHKFAAQNALIDIICSGVLERYPRLKIVVAEIGVGWIPYWLQDADHHFQYRELSHLPLLPSDYFKRQVYATFIDDAVGASMLPRWGLDNFIWSNDFPHSDGVWPASREVIAHTLGHLSPAERARVVCTTTAELYGKAVPAPLPIPEGAAPDSQWSRRLQAAR